MPAPLTYPTPAAERADKARELSSWMREFEISAPHGMRDQAAREADELVEIAADVRRLVARVGKLDVALDGSREAQHRFAILAECLAETITDCLTQDAAGVLVAAVRVG